MTFSIVALSDDGAHLGVATASASLALGRVVPALAPGVGALVTQAHTNGGFRARGLTLLRAGASPGQVLAEFSREDPRFDLRQVGIVDLAGRTAAWTGGSCTPWAGHAEGERMVVAGNLLHGPGVLAEMASAYRAASGGSPGGAGHAGPTSDGDAAGGPPWERFSRALVAALAAGEATGGDSRGRQSAALVLVRTDGPDVAPPATEVDLRVDDHADPVGELARLLDLRVADVG